MTDLILTVSIIFVSVIALIYVSYFIFVSQINLREREREREREKERERKGGRENLELRYFIMVTLLGVILNPAISLHYLAVHCCIFFICDEIKNDNLASDWSF